MATKAQESTVKKEKTVPSPSNSHTTQRSRSTKQPIQSSIDKDKSPSTKRVPNYLRPTASSRLETFNKQVTKKNGPEDSTTPKPTLVRRRSFDKPPSPSRVQKAITSPAPGERTTAREKTPPLRSSSFTPKSGISLKPSIEGANSRSPKTGKPMLSSGKNMKKSTIPSIKKDSIASSSTKAPKSPNTIEKSNIETKHGDKESMIHEAEEEAKVENEIEVILSDVQKPEVGDVLDTEVDNVVEEEEVNACDIPIVSDHQNVSQNANVEEIEDKSREEKGDTQNEGEENETKDQIQTEENAAEEDKTEAEENSNDKDIASDKELVEKNKIEDKALDEKQQDGEGIGEIKPEEARKKESGIEEIKIPEAANVAPKGQGGQGKKDTQAYNDVIEETASKLLEKRKNKVKALVGAFETVIDYESSSK